MTVPPSSAPGNAKKGGVPHYLVIFAGGDVRTVAERIIDIAPQLNAAGQVGVGVHPQAVVAGVVAGFAQKVGGVAETPVTRQVETSPFGLVA